MTLRQRTANLLGSKQVENFIVGVIIFNAVILGLETSGPAMARAGGITGSVAKFRRVVEDTEG